MCLTLSVYIIASVYDGWSVFIWSSLRGRTMSIPGVITIDVTMTLQSLTDDATRMLQVLRPQWKQENIVFKHYSSGLSNTLVGCRLAGDADQSDMVLIRMYGEGTTKLVDRNLEMVMMYIFNASGHCQPLLARFNNGIMYGYQKGICPTLEMIREPRICRLVAEELARIHHINPEDFANTLPAEIKRHLQQRKPSLFDRTRHILNLGPTDFASPALRKRYSESALPPIAELPREVDLLETELSKLGSPVVLSHNDTLVNNIIYREEINRCYMIDFEYTDFNYQAFDIGYHFSEWAGMENIDYSLYPDKTTQLAWIKHYLTAYNTLQGRTDVTPTDTEILTLYIQAQKFTLLGHLYCASWGIVEADPAPLDFDYLGYVISHIKRYFDTKKEFLSLELPIQADGPGP